MMITGLILLAAFVATVVLIIRGQSPIVMLLLLAIVWSAVAGIGINDIQAKILHGGGVAYASAVIVIVFGSWFAQVLIQTGIASSVIRAAAELAGDRPVVTTMVISTTIALLFTSMYGVGAAIALGVIALPIMMSQGVPPVVAAPAFTMGIGAGTFINLVNFGIMRNLFPGIEYGGSALVYWVIGGIVYLAFAWLLVAVNMRRTGVRHSSAVETVAPGTIERPRTPLYTFIVPLVPVLMITVLKWEIIPTFLVSIVLALALTAPTSGRGLQASINLFNKTFYDAFPDIATIAALWTICGMIIVAGQSPQVVAALKPVFTPILPQNNLQAALLFGLFGGIGNIYRGPLAVIGTGAAMLAIILSSHVLAVPYLYSLWVAPNCLQGSMDPTNSWTLWTIGYTRVSQGDFLKTALPFGCAMVAVNSAIAYLMLG
jgi:hypothetical protein